jgi:hypothetical protein
LFVHIPKTAGTSFRLAVEEAFPDRVMFDYGPKSERTSEEVRHLVHGERDLKRLSDLLLERRIVMLVGHVEYSRYADIFPPERVVAFVREPVARLVSEWQHLKRNYGFTGSLLDFGGKQRSRDAQTRVLRGAPLREMGFLGITERYAESLDAFSRKFGFELRELKRNARPVHEPAPELSASELDQLREWNERDLRLYQRAIESFERHSAPSARTAGRSKPREGAKYRRTPLPLVSREQRLAVLFTPKAGCTFAVSWYFEQTGLLAEALAHNHWVHRFRHEYCKSDRYRPEHIADPGMRIVKFVRNPFDRAVSSYVHAVRTGYADKEVAHFLGRELSRQKTFSFREFVEYLGSTSLRTCNPHHRLQLHELEAEGLVRVDHVVQVEHGRQQVPALEASLGLKATDLDRLMTSTHHATRVASERFVGDDRLVLGRDSASVAPTRNFYDDALAARVATLYATDFAAYGYETTPPHERPAD